MERQRRGWIRDTYLKYYQDLGNPDQMNIICSLDQLQSNNTLAADPKACRFIYTFVMGGGNISTGPNICYWGEESCGGSSHEDWVLDAPEFNFSDPEELETHHDFSWLVTKENHEDGKTETFFTYATLLAVNRPDLHIDFVGKLDSDTVVFVQNLWPLIDIHEAEELRKFYIAGGWVVPGSLCSKKSWGHVCSQPGYTAPVMLPGGAMFASTLLAQHTFLDETSLEFKKSKFFRVEDMSFTNIIYGDPSIPITEIDWKDGPKQPIVLHPKKTKEQFMGKYWQHSGLDYHTIMAKRAKMNKTE